jgi:hypothetical protein
VTILSATVERPDLIVISIVTMASKWLCSVHVVLNSIVKVVSVCPYPAVPNHGIGLIVGSNDPQEVRTLQENEQFQFRCRELWIPIDSEIIYFTCRDGILQGGNVTGSLNPICGNEMHS